MRGGDGSEPDKEKMMHSPQEGGKDALQWESCKRLPRSKKVEKREKVEERTGPNKEDKIETFWIEKMNSKPANAFEMEEEEDDFDINFEGGPKVAYNAMRKMAADEDEDDIGQDYRVEKVGYNAIKTMAAEDDEDALDISEDYTAKKMGYNSVRKMQAEQDEDGETPSPMIASQSLQKEKALSLNAQAGQKSSSGKRSWQDSLNSRKLKRRMVDIGESMEDILESKGPYKKTQSNPGSLESFCNEDSLKLWDFFSYYDSSRSPEYANFVAKGLSVRHFTGFKVGSEKPITPFLLRYLTQLPRIATLTFLKISHYFESSIPRESFVPHPKLEARAKMEFNSKAKPNIEERPLKRLLMYLSMMRNEEKKKEHFEKEFEKIVQRGDLSLKGKLLLKRMKKCYGGSEIVHELKNDPINLVENLGYLNEKYLQSDPDTRRQFYLEAALMRIDSKSSMVDQLGTEKIGELYCKFLDEYGPNARVSSQDIRMFVQVESKLELS
jgi:hypothetical protein